MRIVSSWQGMRDRDISFPGIIIHSARYTCLQSWIISSPLIDASRNAYARMAETYYTFRQDAVNYKSSVKTRYPDVLQIYFLNVHFERFMYLLFI